MRKTKRFIINGKTKEYPLYQSGDRVMTDEKRDGVRATGTVNYTTDGGLFVDVAWDMNAYPTEQGPVHLGSLRLVDGLTYEPEIEVFQVCASDAVAAYSLDDAIRWYKEETGLSDWELYAEEDMETVPFDRIIQVDMDSEEQTTVGAYVKAHWRGEPFIAVTTF